jgi:hypothetical protein
VADFSESGTILDAAGRSTNGNGWQPPNSAAQQFTPRVQPYQPMSAEVPTVSTHQVQAADEGARQGELVDDGTKVEFLGRRFRISDRVGLMPLLRFAHSARGGVDQTDPKALIALYDMIADCVDQTRPQRLAVDPSTGGTKLDPATGQPVMEDAGPSEWDLFQDYATDQKADDEDLMDFVGAVIEVLSARPKRRRGSSPDGPEPTSENSRAGSPSPGIGQPTGGRVPPELDGLVSVDSLVHGRS